jgi:hypothetical protein
VNDSENANAWVEHLRSHVAKHPIVLLRLSEDEFEALSDSRGGLTEFTLTEPHDLLREVQVPCVCLIFGKRSRDSVSRFRPAAVSYLGVLQSRAPVATLDSRIKITRGAMVYPSSVGGLVNALEPGRYATDLSGRLRRPVPIFRLAPQLSIEVIDALLREPRNRGALRTVATGLRRPEIGPIEKFQFDAVQTALKAFGLPADAHAASLDLASQAKSSLAQARVMEDAVIEHDARVVPGYAFIGSDVTGRATFRNGSQTLEVYTANRRALEEAFGVDLIYLNLFQRNIVMVQYKMLEPGGGGTDWVYHEDAHLQKQLRTMRLFRSRRGGEYRLNTEAFYFKFVRRQGPLAQNNILLPLSHFELMLRSPKHRSRSNAVKITYNMLDGRYMRQTAFFSLLQSGYIGCDASTASHLRALVKGVVSGDGSIVVAVQRETRRDEAELDRERLVREHAVEQPDVSQEW